MSQNILSCLSQYLDYHKTFKKSVNKTIQWHQDSAHRFVKEMCKHSVHEITQMDAQEFIVRLNAQGNRLESIKTKIRSLKAFFTWLKKRKVIETNPFLDLEFPGKDEPRIKFMLEDEVRDLFSRLRRCDLFHTNFQKTRAIAILSLAYGLGLRLGEIKQLKLEEIDFQKKLLRITRQKNKGVSLIPFSPRVAFDLQEYLKEKDKLGLDPFHLITSRRGNPLADNGYRRLSKFIKEEVCPNFKGYHSLRHSNATSLLRRGVDINLISKLLRHSSTKVTEMYAKLIPEDLRQTVDVLDY